MKQHLFPLILIVALLSSLAGFYIYLTMPYARSAMPIVHKVVIEPTQAIATSIPIPTRTPTPIVANSSFQRDIVPPTGYYTSDQFALMRQYTGATWVTLSLIFTQQTNSSTHITVSSPTQADMIRLITNAHEAGFHVVIAPSLHIAKGSDAIPGKTAKLQQVWFSAYIQSYLPYLSLFQHLHVEEIGTTPHLSWLMKNGNFSSWHTLFQDIRKKYGGMLFLPLEMQDITLPLWVADAALSSVSIHLPLSSLQYNGSTWWMGQVRQMERVLAKYHKTIVVTMDGHGVEASLPLLFDTACIAIFADKNISGVWVENSGSFSEQSGEQQTIFHWFTT